ncbi:uncharacterized protein CEXT_386141, partial [Caerostris extrusa]
MKSCISCRCIWLCFKALSGGVLLIAIGVGMTVFGFYADTFAVQEQLDEETNTTVHVVNEHLKLHLHNLTGRQGQESEALGRRGTAHRQSGALQRTFLQLDLPPAKVPTREGARRWSPSPKWSPFPTDQHAQTRCPCRFRRPQRRARPACRRRPGRGRPPEKRFRKSSSTFSFLSPLFDALPPRTSRFWTRTAAPRTAWRWKSSTPSPSATPRLQFGAPLPCVHRERRTLGQRHRRDGVQCRQQPQGQVLLGGQDIPLLSAGAAPFLARVPHGTFCSRGTGRPARRFQLMRQVPHNARTLFDGPSSEGS